WQVVILWVIGMLITFWYAKAKFNWTQELAIGSGAGPVAVLLGMFAITPNPDWVSGLIISVPLAISPEVMMTNYRPGGQAAINYIQEYLIRSSTLPSVVFGMLG
ncbi:unnamed protein product, partial [marine sediment metagenome]